MSKPGFISRISTLAAAVFVVAGGCAPLRWIIQPPGERPALVNVEDFEGSLADDMDVSSLEAAADRSVEYLMKIDPSTRFTFGERSLGPAGMIASIRRLVEIVKAEPDPSRRSAMIAEEFEIYEGDGRLRGGDVLVTGYYQPLLDGRRERDEVYKWPIYRAPDDLVSADLGLFFDDMRGRRITGRVSGGRFVPYYGRREIDKEGALAGRGLEIVWVDDPVELFMLHVQGSGIVRLENGDRILVNYAAANGRRYNSIGRLLIEEGAIGREEMSLQSIKRWFGEHPDQIERVLEANPSYVFFREMDDGPFGSTGVKLVAGRSAAFDLRRFPAGAVAHIETTLPVVVDGDVTGWRRAGRFVFCHDSGGAIKGPGRMDLFFGAGDDAEAAAGVMKHPGDLLFFALKPGVMGRLMADK